MKKYLSFSLLFLLLIPLSAQTPKRFNYGIYSGWSFGTSNDFKTNSTPHTDMRYRPWCHLGAYLQYNFEQNFALQFNINLQPIKYEEKSRESSWKESDYNKFCYITSLTLNTVITSKRLPIGKLYLISGAGLSFGDWDYWPDVYYNMTLEPGVKLYFFKSKSDIAIKLGMSIHHLRGTKKLHYRGEYSKTATYIRLNIGIEL